MSSVVTSVLHLTVGFLFDNDIRDLAAVALQNEVTDAKIRENVVRALNDLKKELYGKKLLKSYNFLQEGVTDLLNISLNVSKPEQQAVLNDVRQDDQGESSTMPSAGISGEAQEYSNVFGKMNELNDVQNLLNSNNFLQEGATDLPNISLNGSKPEQQAVLNDVQDDQGETSTMPSAGISDEALEVSNAIGKMKEFESAKEKFKGARMGATDAFLSEELSIRDRIFAAKLRIVSEILECLESPETAITRCLPFLKKLHSLPVIEEIFRVHLRGGFKSLLNRSKREECITSVMLINYVLFQLIQKFSSEYSFEVLAWPTIELQGFSFHPILHWPKISQKKSMQLPEPPPIRLSSHDKGTDQGSFLSIIILRFKRLWVCCL
jgi:hypothetical protein